MQQPGRTPTHRRRDGQVHPGIGTAALGYGEEREREVVALCDDSVREAVRDEGLVLASFAAIPSPVR